MPKNNKRAAIGIGAMIIFIAMILTAGIAAYLILSTGSQLEITSGLTGQQTIKEVSTGVKISTIEAHNTSGVIDKAVITVIPRSGSPNIELSNTIVEVSNSVTKYVLRYSSAYWVDGSAGVTNIFQADAYSPTSSEYGLIVIKDDDHSCSQNAPVLTRGDSVMITLNTYAIFGGIPENTNIQGNVIPEEGAWGIILFRTPSAYAQEIFLLQEG